MLLSEIVKLQKHDELILEGMMPSWLKNVSSVLPKSIQSIILAGALLSGANTQAATPDQIINLATALKTMPDSAWDNDKVLKLLRRSPRFDEIPPEQLADIIDLNKDQMVAGLKQEFIKAVKQDFSKSPKNEVAHVAAEEWDKIVQQKKANDEVQYKKDHSVLNMIGKTLGALAQGMADRQKQREANTIHMDTVHVKIDN